MIGRLTGPWQGGAPFLIRVAAGSVFLYHGLDRLGIVGMDGFRASIKTAIKEAATAGFSPPELWGYLLALTAAIGGGMILIGLFTRYAALVLAFVMGVAVFKVYWNSGFSVQARGWEYTFTLLCCCLSLVISGGGSASTDELLWPTREKEK